MEQQEYILRIIYFTANLDSNLSDTDKRQNILSLEGLNRVGQEGWKVVSTDTKDMEIGFPKAFFKRRMQSTSSIVPHSKNFIGSEKFSKIFFILY